MSEAHIPSAPTAEMLASELRHLAERYRKADLFCLSGRWQDLCAAIDRLAALARSEPRAREPIPEGWKLVPLEPTDAMKHAANVKYRDDRQATAAALYRAMLAAAPPVKAHAGEPKP
jgi:hypothetical protein